MCRLDAEQVLRIVDRLRERSERRWLRSGEYREPTDLDAARWQRLRTELTNRGYGLADRWHTPMLWEADHMVPVIEGAVDAAASKTIERSAFPAIAPRPASFAAECVVNGVSRFSS